MANPFTVQPAQYGQGLAGLGQSLAQAGQIKQQRDKEAKLQQAQAEQKAELEEVFAQAEEALVNKDYDAINTISIRYPKVGENVLKALGADDERKQKNIVETGFKVLQNPDNYDQIIDDNPIFAEQMGGADLAKKTYAENPEKTLDQARQLLAWTGGDQWKQFREYEKSKAKKEIEPMSEYQREMVRQKDAEIEIRNAELENKKLESQLKRETDELKKEQLEIKIEENNSKVETAKSEVIETQASTYISAMDTISLVADIENHPGFSDYVGAKGLSSGFGVFDSPVSGTDAAGVASMIETLSSQNFLNSVKQMRGMGALSENEGKKLSAAVSSLDPGMPEKDFKRSLNVIKNLTTRASKEAARIIRKSGGEVPKWRNPNAIDAPQEAIDMLMKNPRLKGQFLDKFGYLPEGVE